ncbi:4937_t:CDS:2 [Acaulospora colombiana]|uniref:4937_t:CDS:1 n=1 Tax=Acaulospora colombiana TaxID=27376 RepID=A0ACA9MPS2_9GLOM|nr:4937_t:CDS:2 [Acaulospora colombiana]
MTDYNSSTPTSPRVRHTTRVYRDYTSSFDEAEESDAYEKRFSETSSNRWRANSVNSAFGLTFVQGRRFEIKEEDNNNSTLSSRRRRGRNWETDDELFKPTFRNSCPISQLPSHNQNSNNNSPIDEATRSLLYLLNKERTKRRELQKAHEESLQELRKRYDDDIQAHESDIQTLQDALLKESKVKAQLNNLLREAQAKFTEEMQVWARKVAEMEAQGKELQKTFLETMEQLEREEEEIMRLRKENQALREQSAGNCTIDSSSLSRRNLEDVLKVGSMEDRDDISVSTETKHTMECNEISDTESVMIDSRISELKDRIAELENELISTKEENQKYKSALQEREVEMQSAIKQLEEKNEKQVRLLRANITQQQKTISDLNQNLRKAKYNEHQKQQKQPHQLIPRPSLLIQQKPLDDDDDESSNHHRMIQNKRRAILADLSENLSLKERKNSVTSTNSGSVESNSIKSGSIGGKDGRKNNVIEDGEEQSEVCSEEEDDQSSSFCTGSENWVQSRFGSEEAASTIELRNKNLDRLVPSLSERQQHQHQISDEGNELEDEEYMLDAILSDREDRSLPLIGHYSAAEFTEDEDYVDYTDRMISGGGSISRRHSLTEK